MCGLCVAKCNDHEWEVRKMLQRLKHRGLRSKIHEGRGWSMGHARLPIVGLGEENDQPRRGGGFVFGFVGEILDFRERHPGMGCDLDLVVRTWLDEGPAGFRDFDGFWHIVAVDESDGCIHAVVDYLAQKPLYYRCDPECMAVASELDAISCTYPVTPDRIYLSSCMKWGYCPDVRRTPYEQVKKVLPGEYLRIEDGGVLRKKVDDILPIRNGTEEMLRTEIRRAVRRRVVSSDVPVACLVSGGLDSSIVLMEAMKHSDVHKYYVENGEYEYCRRIAPDATVLGMDGFDRSKELEYMQEPIDLGSLVPQIVMSDAIAGSSGEYVCLTGDGADEMFGGYGRAERYDSQASDVWQELVGWHLPRLDRVMMRNRIEVRSPFLARNVVRIAMGLPWSERRGKKILKRCFREYLPQVILDRPKHALRTKDVEYFREQRSKELVERFVKMHWGN